jgi:hypothetical protein
MPDDPAELRRKAEACRELAEMSDAPARKAHWIGQAQHREALALKAEAPKANNRRPRSHK